MPARIGRFIPTHREARCVRSDVSGLRCRRLRRPTACLRELRPHRDPGEPAGRDTGVAAWRDLPVLRERLQGRAASRTGTGITVRAEPARLRALSAFGPGHPAGTTVLRAA